MVSESGSENIARNKPFIRKRIKHFCLFASFVFVWLLLLLLPQCSVDSKEDIENCSLD